MNNNKKKTKEQLLNEVNQLSRRISELETSESNRKKVCELQCENEEKYRELADSINDVFFAMDKDLRYTYWNKASEKLTGIAMKDAIGKSIFDIFPDTEDTRRAVSVYRDVLKRRQSQNFVNEYNLKGKTYFFEISAYPSKNGISVFVKDITERKKAEERIQNQSKFLENILESITNPLYVLNINDYTIKMANKAARFGSISERSTCYELTHKSDEPCVFPEDFCPLEEIKKTKKPVTVEHIHYDKDGNARFLEIHGFPIFDSEGNVFQMIEYSIDITKRRKAEEELAEYKKQLHQSERLAATGRLAASIAHEINNPLQAISFNLDFVKNEIPDDFKEKSSIEQIKIGTKRIKSTVRQLLDIHRGKIEVKEKVNANDIIEATLNLFKNQLVINKIEVKKSLSSDIPLINGLTQELYQVFMNLILNAQDAMEKGGILNISTKAKDNKLRIIFEDNGCGISKEEIDHIFEPFYTTKPVMLGTGLGLSTSKGIIGSYGGEIDVKSTIGKGSTFTITFPIIK